jgi:cytochrome c
MGRKTAALAVLGAFALAAGLLASSGTGLRALAGDDDDELSPEDLKAAKAAEEDAHKLGQKLFGDPSIGAGERACSKCHDNPKKPQLSLKGVAAKFPRWDRNAGKVITLQQKFMQMQERNLKAKKAFPLGDDRWNALELYLKGLK